jgi:hypothetical protein
MKEDKQADPHCQMSLPPLLQSSNQQKGFKK